MDFSESNNLGVAIGGFYLTCSIVVAPTHYIRWQIYLFADERKRIAHPYYETTI